MQLKHYAQVFLRSLWMILLGTALCTGLTYGISRVIKPIYQSSALIQVNTLSPLTNDSVYGNQALAINYALLVTNDDVLQKAAQKLPGVSAGQLAGVLSVAPEDTTAIIQIQAKANDPQLAADIANAVANAFIQIQEAKAASRFQTMANSVMQELASDKAHITHAQADLAQLQKDGSPASKISSQQSVLDGYQTNYNALLTSYQQIKLQQVQVSSTLVEIQTATPSWVPVSPKTTTNTLIAGALGLLLMIILVLLLDWLNTTVKTPEDVANLAGLTPLGSMPKVNNPLLYNIDPSVATEDVIEQAAIIIGTNVKVGRKARVVLVTGVKAGVGATTNAANLAVSLAQTGKRVLLIDANFVRPALHTLFRFSDAGSWVHAFANLRMLPADATPEALLQPWRTDIPNLWFLPLGALPARYSVVALASQLEALVKLLLRPVTKAVAPGQGQIDMVIIDAPSLRDGANTVALASIAQGSILVIGAGEERSHVLRDASAKLKVLNAPLVGVIVNRQQSKHRPYFYVDKYQPNIVQTINAPETNTYQEPLAAPAPRQSAFDAVSAEATKNSDTLPSWSGIPASAQQGPVRQPGNTPSLPGFLPQQLNR
jgi:tyrosine-protein kinase